METLRIMKAYGSSSPISSMGFGESLDQNLGVTMQNMHLGNDAAIFVGNNYEGCIFNSHCEAQSIDSNAHLLITR